MPAYTVFVDDNFHYQDEDDRYKLGTFESYADALATCHRIVDEFLTGSYKPGVSESDLYSQYTMFGEDPFIMPDDVEPRFSAWTYARQRCAELCAGGQ